MGTAQNQRVDGFILQILQITADHLLGNGVVKPALLGQRYQERTGLSVNLCLFIILPLSMVAVVPTTPTRLFFVTLPATLAAASMTPITGIGSSLCISSRAQAVAVLQAITMAFTSFVIKKRTICLEKRITVFFDLVP